MEDKYRTVIMTTYDFFTDKWEEKEILLPKETVDLMIKNNEIKIF